MANSDIIDILYKVDSACFRTQCRNCHKLLRKSTATPSFIVIVVGSSNSSHSNPRDQNHERLETHLEAEQSEDEEDQFIDENFKGN